MKILYHHRTLGDGAEGIHIREMVKAFRELGHTIKVIGPVGETPPEASTKPMILSRIKAMLPHALYELLEISYTVHCFLRTAMVCWSFKPDFIYDRYIIFNAGTVLAAKFVRVPICLEVNAPLAKERSIEKDEQLFFRRIATWMEAWVCSNATETVVVSTPLKDYLESIGVPSGKCVVMPNGVDPIRFAPRQPDVSMRTALGIPEDHLVIGFSGILRGWHGLEILVRAVGRMTVKRANVFLLIVGDGPYRATFEQMIADQGIQNVVHITGRIPYEEVAENVSLFDVAVSPKATFYASPMKVIEYMSLGKPVVVPDTQNFLDIIEERETGITFKDGDINGLQVALQSLVDDPELRHALGARAREKVLTRLNWRWNAIDVCNRLGKHGRAL